jgi:NADPH-dependent F420 reductase
LTAQSIREDSVMDVTIIGTGNMARGIGTRLATAGARLQILGRNADEARTLANELSGKAAAGQVTAGQLDADPVAGDVVVLALPYDAAVEVAKRLADQLANRIVVDITNPVNFATFDGLVVPPDSSAAQELAKLLPGATVVKAFNTTFAGTLTSGEVNGQPLDVFIATDSPEAAKAIASLVEQAGMRPIEIGPLRRARELEAMGYVHMLAQDPAGTGFGSALKLYS